MHSYLIMSNYYDAHQRLMHYSIKRIFAFQNISSHLHILKRKLPDKNAEYQVEVPSWRIHAKEHGSAIVWYTSFSIRLDYYYYNYKWRFTLDEQLRLNITFEYIYISINNYYGCNIGNLPVKAYLKLDTLDFVYCGMHSFLISYPQYRNVDIVLDVRIWIIFKIQLSYSVTDPNIIVSSMPPKKRKFQPLWMVYFQEIMS